MDQYVQAVRHMESQLESISDDQLRQLFCTLRSDASVDTQDSIVQNFVCAAALAAQAVQRTLGFRMHQVQIRGALAASSGCIIEMQTGEGKTVVCGMTALIRSIFDQSVHVATTNDYLAERDHESVQPVFQLLGTSSAVIFLDSSESQTRKAYRCNITYGPGYLFGFDYLKDQIKLREIQSTNLGQDVLIAINGRNVNAELAQHCHQSIIVDEADSVLIDESTTPLILSGGKETVSPSVLQGYEFAQQVSRQLKLDEHYQIDYQQRAIDLLEIGQELIHEALHDIGKLDLLQPWPGYIRNALFAEHLLLKDEHYVVQDDQIKLVDQNTGRIFEDRTLRGGLHQAVEAKENLEINPPSQTMARLTRQRFFQLYETVCGMTGTASGSETELNHFYATPVISIPQNKLSKRIEFPDRFFRDWDSKLIAITQDVQQRLPTGQPILIGTRTIKESIMVDEALRKIGVQAIVLNGVQDSEEAEIVREAGKVGSLTIATNMAGRGTDIKLTAEAKRLGGLHVIGTQRHTSRRVDRQLAGRSARQGDPGSVRFFISADDDLFQKFGVAHAAKITSAVDGDGESRKDFAEEIARLQMKIEAEQFELRRRLVRQDCWMDQVRETMVQD